MLVADDVDAVRVRWAERRAGKILYMVRHKTRARIRAALAFPLVESDRRKPSCLLGLLVGNPKYILPEDTCIYLQSDQDWRMWSRNTHGQEKCDAPPPVGPFPLRQISEAEIDNHRITPRSRSRASVLVKWAGSVKTFLWGPGIYFLPARAGAITATIWNGRGVLLPPISFDALLRVWAWSSGHRDTPVKFAQKLRDNDKILRVIISSGLMFS